MLEIGHNTRVKCISWNPDIFEVNIIFQPAQLIHCYVVHKSLNRAFDCPFVYGFNDDLSSDQLRKDLITISDGIKDAWFVGVTLTTL